MEFFDRNSHMAWKNKKISSFVRITVVVVIAQLLFSIYYSGRQPLWLDEIYQVSFSGCDNSLMDTLMKTETSPPLFRLIANIWYNNMPFGEAYLLLLSEIFVSIGILFAGIIGHTFFCDEIAIVMEVLYGFSTVVIEKCSFEFRSYALLNMLTWMLMYVLLKRRDNNDSGYRYFVEQGVLMTLLAYTHYFGVILCVVIGIIDFILWIKNNFKHYYIVTYVMLGVMYVPWIIRFTSLAKTIQPNQSWMMDPTVNNAYILFSSLVGGYSVIIFLFLVGFAYLLKTRKYNYLSKKLLFLPIIVIEVFVIMWIYGKYISPNATLWVLRYFTILIPAIIITVGYSLLLIKEYFVTTRNHMVVKCIVIACLFLYILQTACAISLYVSEVADGIDVANHNDFRAAADWIYEDKNKYKEEDTALAMTNVGEAEGVIDGWHEYYITRKGSREGMNVVTTNDADKLLKYKYVYYCVTPCADDRLSEIINLNYTLVYYNEDYSIYFYVRNY